MTASLTDDLLRFLLARAAQCVEAAVHDRPDPPRRDEPALASIGGGVFVTLRYMGQLAGCIGYVQAPPPLIETVERAARAAVVNDARFARLLVSQLPDVDVELSILSPLTPIEATELEPGREGGLLRWRGRQGLLLPQVATEHGLDRDAFLQALCEKSGVPPATYLRDDCELFAFTVQKREGHLTDLLWEGNTA